MLLAVPEVVSHNLGLPIADLRADLVNPASLSRLIRSGLCHVAPDWQSVGFNSYFFIFSQHLLNRSSILKIACTLHGGQDLGPEFPDPKGSDGIFQSVTDGKMESKPYVAPSFNEIKRTKYLSNNRPQEAIRRAQRSDSRQVIHWFSNI